MARATLTTLTPVHIGNGQKLIRNLDFIVEQERVGFIDLEKIVGIIGVEQIGQITQVIEKRGSLVEFLQKGREQINLKLEDICHRIASQKSAGSVANEMKEQYHTSLKGACIPGSSLKGAIKTAIWERLATKEKQANWNQRDYGRERNGNLDKFFDSAIDKKLFGPNANEKTTRFLKVGDIHFPDICTSVYEVGIFNAGYEGWAFKNGQSFLAECIPDQSSSHFELKLDKEWFNRNKTIYPEKWSGLFTEFITGGSVSFCSLLNNFLSKQLGYELEDLKKEEFDNDEEGEEMLQQIVSIKTMADTFLRNQESSAIIRVGGNSGWNFTTGGWVKSASEKALNTVDYNAMRRTIQRGKTYDMELWPKTRKMTMAGLPLGFVKITLQP